MYKIIQKRKIWISISAILIAVSIFAFFKFGLNLGIDFTGGSLLEVRYNNERPEIKTIEQGLTSLDLKGLTIQPTDNNGFLFRFQDTDATRRQAILSNLEKLNKKDSTFEELRYESIGPSIGYELRRNSLYAITIVLIAIAIYIAYAFRKVSRPVASWKYGVAGIIALLHDVIIVVGAFAILGKYFNIEVNTPFVAALLTVVGYSINDTIVVFDRIRENLPKSMENFENTVNNAINQTLVRSLNTSFAVLIILLAIVIFGGESIRYFALALFIGIFFGTYSSIFLASPLLVVWEERKRKKQA